MKKPEIALRQVLCKHHGTDAILDHQQQAQLFTEDLMAALAAEMPVLSAKLFDLLEGEARTSETQTDAVFFL